MTIRKKVLLIGIDGCRPDALQAARTPNLDSLIEGGAVSFVAQTVGHTFSGPGWASMLTGVGIGKHGVVDNSFADPHFNEYPHFFNRLNEMRPELHAASVVNWEPINGQILSHADFTFSDHSDSKVSRVAAQLIVNDDHDVVFLHLDDVDAAGHAQGYGPEHPSYLKAIEVVDSQVGEVLNAIKSRESYLREDWLVVVSTDHGGTGTKHGPDTPENRTIFLIVSGSSAQRGVIEPPPQVFDVPPTIFAHLGIDVQDSWSWDGRSVGLKVKRFINKTLTQC